MRREGRLYCIFTRVDKVQEVIDRIKGEVEGKIFVLDIGKENEVVVTCNGGSKIPEDLLKSTVLCHRHKLTQTLYTINALNIIVRGENNGEESKNYQIDWSKYQDSLLVVQNKELIQFKTKLINII